MKKYTKINKLDYREFDSSDFNEVFKIFLEFQLVNKMSDWDNPVKGVSDMMKHTYWITEFMTFTKRCRYKYVVIDTETQDMVGFIYFSEGVFSVRSEVLELQLICKKTKYRFCLEMKRCLESVIDIIRNDRKVYAVLGEREKFDKYLKFLKKVFNVKVLDKDQFGNTLIEFDY